MEAIAYSVFRKHLAETMDRVCDNHDPIIITRQNARSAVLISLEDYNSIQETDYLLRSPANAAKLRVSIQEHHEGKYHSHGLLDE